MICEKCHANPATVHVQQIINGEKKESFLCQSCAGEADAGVSFGNLFQGFMDAFLKSAAASGGNVAPAHNVDAKCSDCGYTYNDFKKSGKLGCGKCYAAFKRELDQILKNIHGSSLHEGKFPQKSGVEMMQRKTLESLRLSLHKAVQDEEYEKAASLRDQIKEIERNAAVSGGNGTETRG